MIKEIDTYMPSWFNELKAACEKAMFNTLAARIPECGDFGEIAQSLSFVIQEIQAGIIESDGKEIHYLCQRIAELEAIIDTAGKQRPYAFDSATAGLSFENPYSDAKPLYLHPDYASEARIRELEAEFNQCSGMLDDAERALEQLEDNLSALQSQHEMLRKDAERYRWMRDKNGDPPDELDVAIDAAMVENI